jgi:prepilin-type N-terminal cleavage/methylation domain-containing protein
MRRRMKNDKGFTLAELLIVVAIIAVLVAVSIPIFSAQLEKAREATDVANFRAAKAAFIVALLDGTMTADKAGDKYYYHADTGIVNTTPVTVPYGEGRGGPGNNPFNALPDGKIYPEPYDAGLDYSSAYIYAEYSRTTMKDSLKIHWYDIDKGTDVTYEVIDLSEVNKPDVHVDPTTETNTTYP